MAATLNSSSGHPDLQHGPFILMRSAKLFLLGVTLASAAAPCVALPVDIPLDRLRVTTWTARDGAPADVWGIVQTTDGWMWFATGSGLYRFDGVRFDKVTPHGPGQSNGVSAITALESGELVIGYRNGGISILRSGKFTHYGADEGLDNTVVYLVTLDGDKVFWAGTQNGLYRFDGQRWHRIGPEWMLPAGRPVDMRADGAGTLWVSMAKGIWYLTRGARHFERGPETTGPGDLIEAPDGSLSLMQMKGQIRLSGPMATAARADEYRVDTSRGALIDRDGALWGFQTQEAVGRIAVASPADGYEQVDSSRDSLPSANNQTMTEDRQGNIWIASIDRSIVRVSRYPMQREYLSHGYLGVVDLAIEKDGTPLLGVAASPGKTDVNGAYRIDQRSANDTLVPSAPGIPFVYRASTGEIWAVGRGRLWKCEGKEFVPEAEVPSVDEEVLAYPIAGMAEGEDRTPRWISVVGKGLFFRTPAGWVRNAGLDGLPADAPTALVTDAAGVLWVGYSDGRVFTVRNGHVAAVSFEAGNHVGTVRSISAGKFVIVGGERGFATLNGQKLVTLIPEDPDAQGIVAAIVEGRDGEIWMNTSAGLVRIESEDLAAALRSHRPTIQTQVYDESDGYPGALATNVYYGAKMAEGPDGRIWLLGTNGLASLDPQKVPRLPAPANGVLLSVWTDDGQFDARGHVQMAAGTRRASIEYTALNYAHPLRQRFRYRLVGLDDRWTEAGTRREAIFTNLGPGHYRFELLARGDNGAWPPAPLQFDLDIPPTFIQTRAFMALLAIAAALAMVLVIRAFARRARRVERARMQTRLDERERIARELHDTLLQSTQSLIMVIHATSREVPADMPARAQLEQALAHADLVMAEGRERIQDLRKSQMPSDELHRLLAQSGREERDRHPQTRFSMEIGGAARQLIPNLADEVLRIGREALVNAFRHANADAIELEVVYEREQLRLRVRDNGRGMDSVALESGARPGHYGLRGMRERATALGATLEVWSHPNSGTEVELRVPAPVAYLRVGQPTGFRSAWRRLISRTFAETSLP